MNPTIAQNVVHSLDVMINNNVASLDRRAYGYMLAQSNGRKVRKPGLYDQKISEAKQGWRVGRDAFGLLYGFRNYRKRFLEAVDVRGPSNRPNVLTPAALFFTDRGDFTHLSGRGV